jgi:RES domain
VSSSTWTPSAVASSAVGFEGVLWRVVEAQHHVSTLPLVDTLEEQEELERLLESSKPPIPHAARNLHWLLSTPFRYPPSPYGSRFRAAHDAGVFYGADEVRTACAEISYWRWRFLLDSPTLKSIDSRLQTVFCARVNARAVDLSCDPYVAQAQIRMHPNDYSGTQAYARIARDAEIEAIRYRSVRDPREGMCTALLSARAFTASTSIDAQSWLLSVTHTRAFWHREPSIFGERFEFETSLWRTTDPSL